MIDKTLDGHCCKKDNEGNPHTFYIEQSTIPILLDDCKQGDGVKYYLADVVDSRIKEIGIQLARSIQQNAKDNMRIGQLERQNTHLQANNTKLLLENRGLKSSPPSAADTEAGD